MTQEDEELMLDNFVTFFIAGEALFPTLLPLRHKVRLTMLNIIFNTNNV